MQMIYSHDAKFNKMPITKLTFKSQKLRHKV